MKVTIQFYDKVAKTRNAVAKTLSDKGLVSVAESEDFQTVEVGDALSAKALMKDLSPIPNIQTQTAA